MCVVSSGVALVEDWFVWQSVKADIRCLKIIMVRRESASTAVWRIRLVRESLIYCGKPVEL